MQKLIHKSNFQENVSWFKASCCLRTLIEILQIHLNIYIKIQHNILRTIVEPIVISKLFLDNEIIALIKIWYVATCNNIYYFIELKKFQL